MPEFERPNMDQDRAIELPDNLWEINHDEIESNGFGPSIDAETAQVAPKVMEFLEQFKDDPELYSEAMEKVLDSAPGDYDAHASYQRGLLKAIVKIQASGK